MSLIQFVTVVSYSYP